MTTLKDGDVVCRKPHGCEWCAETINAGERANYRVYIFEGDFCHGWMHMVCWMAMVESTHLNPDVGTDGWIIGDPNKGEVYA